MGLRKQNFMNETLEPHLEIMSELIQRDKNRPSVVMWSVANEPNSSSEKAQSYFEAGAKKTFELDSTQPITFACNKDFSSDLATQFMDVVMINRYYSWYSDPGHPEIVPYQLSYDLDNWYQVGKMPVMISEYGAGTIDGLHEEPCIQDVH